MLPALCCPAFPLAHMAQRTISAFFAPVPCARTSHKRAVEEDPSGEEEQRRRPSKVAMGPDEGSIATLRAWPFDSVIPEAEKGAALRKIRASVDSDMVCPLRQTAHTLVFGKGSPTASIFFIGEAPGEQEDRLGIPFVGPAGRELDVLLRTIGLTLEDVYVANVLKYRPPGNRDPTPEEIKRHSPYLVQQIGVIRPQVLVTLGNFATKFVLSKFRVEGMDKIAGITRLHGQRRTVTMVPGLSFSVVPLYHPAAVLYKPAWKGDLQKDFLTLRDFTRPLDDL